MDHPDHVVLNFTIGLQRVKEDKEESLLKSSVSKQYPDGRLKIKIAPSIWFGLR